MLTCLSAADEHADKNLTVLAGKNSTALKYFAARFGSGTNMQTCNATSIDPKMVSVSFRDVNLSATKRDRIWLRKVY